MLLACLSYHKRIEADSDGQDNETVTFNSNEQDEDGRGRRALHLVAGNGGPASLFCLHTLAGADVNAQDRDRETHLHVAVRKCHEAEVRAQLDEGADANAACQHG